MNKGPLLTYHDTKQDAERAFVFFFERGHDVEIEDRLSHNKTPALSHYRFGLRLQHREASPYAASALAEGAEALVDVLSGDEIRPALWADLIVFRIEAGVLDKQGERLGHVVGLGSLPQFARADAERRALALCQGAPFVLDVEDRSASIPGKLTLIDAAETFSARGTVS